MKSKLHTFYLNCAICDYDLIVLTETWLNESVLNPEVIPNVFTLYRIDRNTNNSIFSKGGGALIAVRNTLKSEPLYENEFLNLELLCVKLSVGDVNIIVVACYIPSGSSLTSYGDYITALSIIGNRCFPNDKLFVIGDFNLTNVTWMVDPENISVLIPIECGNDLERETTENIASIGLFQINYICNENKRLLDLLFTDSWEMCNIYPCDDCLLPIVQHHIPFICDIELDSSGLDSKPSDNITYNYKKMDVNNVSSVLESIDWSDITSENDLDFCLTTFYNILNDIIEKFVPKSISRRSTGPPWNNKDIRIIRNQRNKWYESYVKSGREDQKAYAGYQYFRRSYKKLACTAYCKYISLIKNKIKSNPSNFWSYVNTKRKSTDFPCLMKYDQIQTSDNAQICEMFADFFRSNYFNGSSDVQINSIGGAKISNIPFLQVTQHEVGLYIDNLKFNHSPGPDNIPSSFIKQFKSFLIKPLTIIFNKSLSSGYFPDLWKASYILPLFKSGNKSHISNYRGIAKLSVIPKLFENIVNKFIFFHCKSLISPQQHGFLPGRSTSTNLLEFTSFVSRNLQNGNQIDVFYADFSKAFDRVHHNTLLLKLKLLGINDWLIRWLKSYLENRTQHVLFKGFKSSTITVHSGVPQGSHIGPLLFLLFINDITNVVTHSNILLFADDCKISCSFKDEDESKLLQEDIDRIYEWCNKNKLDLNLKKCKVMSYSRKHSTFMTSYSMNNCLLQRVEQISDIGVLFDPKLTFNLHIDSIINKARSRIGFIFRFSKEFKDVYLLKLLYCTLVRPILEYCNCVWSPRYGVHISRIESVQKKFLLFALAHLEWNSALHLPSYSDRLKLIDLPTLRKRNIIQNVIFVHKVLTGLYDSIYLLGAIGINVKPRALRRNEFLFLRFSRVNYGYHEPINALCRDYNSLYSHIDFNINVQSLQDKLYRIDFIT